jgi:hypothetical protein
VCIRAYVNLAKAFDSVCHAKLFEKLESFGIAGNLLATIKSFLLGRVQDTKVGDSLSDFKPITFGVPQGSVLGPLLVTIYINDLPDSLGPHVTSRLFADDIKTYSVIKPPSEYSALQMD